MRDQGTAARSTPDDGAPAVTWFLLECAHYGYGDPDSMMRVLCEVCVKSRRAVRPADNHG